jgi:hypothetical protein
MKNKIIGLAAAALLTCVLIGITSAGYDVQLSGTAEGSGDHGFLSISKFVDEQYKAISANATTADGKAATSTMAFTRDGNTSSSGEANGDNANVNSITFVNGNYFGSIVTARAYGDEGATTSVYTCSQSQ